MLPGCGLSVKFHRLAEVARNSICQMVMDCAGWRLTGVHTNPLWLGRAATESHTLYQLSLKDGHHADGIRVLRALRRTPGAPLAGRRNAGSPSPQPAPTGVGECMRILPQWGEVGRGRVADPPPGTATEHPAKPGTHHVTSPQQCEVRIFLYPLLSCFRV